MIDLGNISHVAEPFHDYRKAIDAARTTDALKAATHAFAPLFPDADGVAQRMDDKAFLEWRSGLRKERRQQFAGVAFADRFGAILAPEMAVVVGEVCVRLCVPFGLAFNRLVEAGRITINDGRAALSKAKAEPNERETI